VFSVLATSSLGRIIEQEQVAYTLGNVDSLFRQRYPGYRPVTD
jgi:hypothetical protein